MESNTRSDQTLSRLREGILKGDLGPGALLAEASMARQLGVSRVPVREALFTLEQEGLVEFSPTGRAFVKEMTGADFEEIFLLRLSLEPLAARLAGPALRRHAEAARVNIAATYAASSLAEVTSLDLDFHEIILTASGNKRLVKLWRSLRSELELWLKRLHQTHQTQTHATREMTAAGHEELLQTICQGSPSAAEALMRQHIQGWREWLPTDEAEGAADL